MLHLRFRGLPGRGVLLAFGAIACVQIGNGYGEGAAFPFSKAPYIRVPEPGTVLVMWECLTNHPGTVRFGIGGKLDQAVSWVAPRQLSSFAQTTNTAQKAQWPLRTFYLYEAPLTHLKPDTTYSYSVELDGVRTPLKKFRTLSTDARKVRFIVYGDSRSNPELHHKLAERLLQYKPRFILHTGDLVARGGDYDLWGKELFEPLSGVIDQIPLFPAIGNHEQDGTNYLNFLHLPGAGRWYSFDDGPVHALALDFHSEKATEAQFRFAQTDLLASRAPWKIVFLHEPVYNIGGHASSWGHGDYLPLFHRAKVDLVLSGHSHLYERFRPLVTSTSGNPWPITHITTGGGAAPLYPGFNHPALLAHETTNHFVMFEADAQTLKGKAIRIDGTVIDRFEINKRQGKVAADYLAKAYPEESLNLFYELAPSLAGRTGAVPNSTAPADVVLAIVPRGKSGLPAQLQITLAPESAGSYTLVNGPLRAATPPAGKTNLVSAKVLAKDNAKISENSSHELVPPLIFQARVKASQGETISYGTKTKVTQPAVAAAKP